MLSLELILFGGTFLFSNFGPNTTTFVIPAEVYPTIIRATCHGERSLLPPSLPSSSPPLSTGLSAASGKLGAVIGTVAFTPLQKSVGLGPLLIICALIALIGALITLFFTEDECLDLALLDRKVEEEERGVDLASPSDGRPLRADIEYNLSDDEDQAVLYGRAPSVASGIDASPRESLSGTHTQYRREWRDPRGAESESPRRESVDKPVRGA